MVVFLDTYAIIEMEIGNPAFGSISEENAITTSLNLIEAYYAILRLYGIAAAERVYETVKMITIPLKDECIKQGCEFKLANKKMRYSYIDCIGYFTARKYRVLFVTGDKQFKGLPGVEFIR